MVVLIDPVPKFIEVGDERHQEVGVPQQGKLPVAGLGERVGGISHAQGAIRLLFNQEELGFNARLEAEALGTGVGQSARQEDARAEVPVVASAALKVAGDPGDAGLPGEWEDGRVGLRDAGQVWVVRPLPQPVHGKAREARRTVHHIRQALGGDEFGARGTVHVHERHQEELDLLLGEHLLRLGKVEHGIGLLGRVPGTKVPVLEALRADRPGDGGKRRKKR